MLWAMFEPPEPTALGETGGIDLTLLESCLSLPPSERLKQVEEFAEFVLTARAHHGVRWSDSANS